MLKLKPNCECCDQDLPPEALAAICSFECTFCPECEQKLQGVCPNCSGELVRRPIRPASALENNPASLTRYLRQEPCPNVPRTWIGGASLGGAI